MLKAPVLQSAAAPELVYGAQNVEELADSPALVAYGVELMEGGPDEPGLAAQVAGQSQGSHAAAVGLQIQGV